jgi:hypothetical protein
MRILDSTMSPQSRRYLLYASERRERIVAGGPAATWRVGGIILACGESRAAIERIMNDDPFVVRRLPRST